MRLAVSGYYGFRNAGDEAALAGIIRSFGLRCASQPSSFTVMSSDPEWTSRTHGVAAENRMDMGAVRRAISESDLLLCGGGSLLQDVTSLRSLLYYIWVMRVARRLRTPYMVYAQGIGPLRRQVSKVLVRHAARRAVAVTVRDTDSMLLLRNLGVRIADAAVTADPAAVLEPPDAGARREAVRRLGFDSDRPVVGLAPRPWRGADVTGLMAGAARGMAKDGAQVVWLPMHPSLDEPIAKAAAAASGVGVVYGLDGDPAAALAAVGASDLLVGVRLHALIFGALCGTRLVAVAYDPKVTALMKQVGMQTQTHQIADCTPEMLTRSVRDTLARPLQERQASASTVGRLKDAALRNVDVALEAVAAR